ncbi:zinc dependent phospholipase C family protein [Paenibacillus chartarius]|uniref:Zinc dependent phospholipase C family protein n=1 Tax=Paenibacillus chartarius TaxID=747481 RepID=A0ABV6DR59_9BACL
MPNLWTHVLFGEALAGRLGFRLDLEAAGQLNLYRLGCQGPDLLFFHRFLPWQRGSMTQLGSAMHERHCGPVLMDFADKAREHGADSALARYVLGFFTHHVLDRTMHPYVFYRSGYRKWDHQRFEVAMDTLLVHRMRGIETWRFPAWKLIYNGPSLPDSVTDMLAATASAYYPELTGPYDSSDWQQAYLDMVRAHRLFHDPSGLKTLLTLGRIAPLAYKRRPPAADFLNEARREWRHPSDMAVVSTASIMDMWDDAMAEGEHILRTALSYWTVKHPAAAEEARRELAGLIGNRTYDSGLPCEEPLPLQYADPIFVR